MSYMINTFESIEKNINKNIIIKNKYLSKHFKEKTKEYEYLEDHLNKCLEYFLDFIKNRNLELIYNKFLSRLFNNDEYKINKLKEIILYLIYYHDLGKLNPYFQNDTIELLKNKSIINLKPINFNLEEKSSNHSKYGFVVLLYILYDNLFSDTKLNYNDEFIYIVLLISTIVNRHHTYLHNITGEIIVDDLTGDIKNLLDMFKNSEIVKYIVNSLNYSFNNDFSFFIIKCTDKFSNIYYNYNNFKLISNGKNLDIYFLIKLLYSNLVLSDYYASMNYSFGKSKLDIINIDDDLLKELNINFNNSKHFNNLANYKFIPLANCNSLNEVRSNLLYLANKNILHKLKNNNKIFMLTVPTGGGKTNISIKLILDILNYDKMINRVFWVFPFINIIEQNCTVIKNTLKDNSDDIVSAIYSSNINFIKNNIKDMDEINIEEILLNESFLNNKINIISFVNFFNSFIKIKKSNRYKIAHICNSVVVLDEIQSLPENNLDLFYNLIKWISEKYNVYFIIMSATLPNLNYFLEDNKIKIPQVIDNFNDYFNNRFFRRNKIIFRLNVTTIEDIYKLLIDEINLVNLNKILLTFNTISTSIKMYNYIKNKLSDYDVFLLNSNISNVERKIVINYIKKTNNKIILVSTQSIEAGVDLDFDFAIRDYSLLDSIEQIAGRVNRESKESRFNNKIYVIRYKDPCKLKFDFEYIYVNSVKMNLQLNELNRFQNDILNNKDFNLFYKKFADNLKIKNKKNSNLDKPLNEFKKLCFESINKNINIIDNKNQIHFYVPFKYSKDEINKSYDKLETTLANLSIDYNKFNYWSNDILQFDILLKVLNIALQKKDKYYVKLFNSILDLYKFSLIVNSVYDFKYIIEKYKYNFDFNNKIENILSVDFIKVFFCENICDISKIKQRIFDVVKFKKELKIIDTEAVFI